MIIAIGVAAEQAIYAARCGQGSGRLILAVLRLVPEVARNSSWASLPALLLVPADQSF